MDLNWRISGPASCFHVVSVLSQGQQPDDEELAAALQEATTSLTRQLRGDFVPEQKFLEHLVPLAAGIASPVELAEVALTKVIGRAKAQSYAIRYRPLLADLLARYRVRRPDLSTHLRPQLAGLQAQWSTYGSTLLGGVANLCEEGLLVDRADVLLVEPVLGGWGAAHLFYNSVHIEAWDDENADGLGEILRLTWLLSQLNLDLPKFTEDLGIERAATIGSLAMIPPVLAAAERAELASCDQQTLSQAIQIWFPALAGLAEVDSKLADWWNIYQARRPPLPVAFAALDQLIGTPTAVD